MTSFFEKQSDSEGSDKNINCSEHLQDVDFTRKCLWNNLQLKVEDEYLYVPKSHLAMVSPVFRLMFQSEFKEKDLDMLPLPGKKYEDVLTFLNCTHPGARLKVTYEIVPKVLPLAHEYQVKWLLDDCTDVMIKEMDDSKFSISFQQKRKYKSISNPVSLCINDCILAEQYGLNSVIEKFIEKVSSICYAFYKDVSEFNQISIGVRYRILCRRLDSKDKFD